MVIERIYVQQDKAIMRMVTELIKLTKEVGWQIKGRPDDAGVQCDIVAADGKTYRLDILNEPFSLARLAELLTKKRRGIEITAEDLRQEIFVIPENLDGLTGDNLLEQLVETFGNNPLCDIDQRSANQKTQSLVQELLGYKEIDLVDDAMSINGTEADNQAAPDTQKLTICHEGGQFEAQLGTNQSFNSGYLSAIKALKEQNLIHHLDNQTMTESMIDMQHIELNPQNASKYPVFLCCDYRRNTAGKVLADGYVITGNGEILLPTLSGRQNIQHNPLAQCIKIWPKIPESAIMISYVRESANAPLQLIINKPRMRGGIATSPTSEQRKTIHDLSCKLSAWDVTIDYTDLAAYIYMSINWNLGVQNGNSLSSRNYKPTIQTYAKRLNDVNMNLAVPEKDRATVTVGNKTFSVTLNGTKLPFAEYNNTEAEMFKRFVMAYEIRAFWRLSEQHATTNKEAIPYDEEIATKLKELIPTIQAYNGRRLIVFDKESLHQAKENDPRFGAYYSTPEHARYFWFNEEDFEEFLYVAGQKARPSENVEEEITDESAENDAEISKENGETADDTTSKAANSNKAEGKTTEKTASGRSGMQIQDGKIVKGSLNIPKNLFGISRPSEQPAKETTDKAAEDSNAENPDNAQKADNIAAEIQKEEDGNATEDTRTSAETQKTAEKDEETKENPQ